MAETMESQSQSELPSAVVKRKTVTFYPALDIVLLKEVYALNPYALMPKKDETRKWSDICDNVLRSLDEDRKVTVRQCRERVEKFLKLHRTNETASLRA